MTPSFFNAATLNSHFAHRTRADIHAELSSHTFPLTDEKTGLTTFVWLAPDERKFTSVLMRMNRISDKRNLSRGLMHNVEGTPLWTLTIELPTTLRASYGFVPFTGPVPETTPPPTEGRSPVLLDTYNPATCNGWSVFSGPQAQAQTEWQTATIDTPGRHTTQDVSFSDGLRSCYLYQPPGTGHSTLPLLVLTDADTWFDGVGLASALDSAITRGGLPPLLVAGPATTGRHDRMHSLGVNSAFMDDLATTIPAWAEEVSSISPTRLLFAGQSLGGLTSLHLLRQVPGVFDTVISQSPSLWWSPENTTSPAGWADREIDWSTEKLGELTPGPEKIWLSVGKQEGFSVPRVSLLADILRDRGWDLHFHIYDGGHDYAWWRGALVDALRHSLTSP